MNIRFYHARIMPMKVAGEIIEGEVWVQNNRLYFVGEEKDNVQTDGSLNRFLELLKEYGG